MSRKASYTRRELLDYLPMGWNLAADPPAEDARGWRATVLDGADQRWTLEVAHRDADADGRVQALRQAVDRLYREALG